MRVGRRKSPDRSTPIAAAARHRLVESPFERQSVLVDRGREEQDRGVAGRLQPASTAQLAASTDTPQALEAVRGGGSSSANLNQLCRRGRFAPPESRVCRLVPLSSLRPELRRERTNPI